MVVITCYEWEYSLSGTRIHSKKVTVKAFSLDYIPNTWALTMLSTGVLRRTLSFVNGFSLLYLCTMKSNSVAETRGWLCFYNIRMSFLGEWCLNALWYTYQCRYLVPSPQQWFAETDLQLALSLAFTVHLAELNPINLFVLHSVAVLLLFCLLLFHWLWSPLLYYATWCDQNILAVWLFVFHYFSWLFVFHYFSSQFWLFSTSLVAYIQPFCTSVF